MNNTNSVSKRVFCNYGKYILLFYKHYVYIMEKSYIKKVIEIES